MGGDIHGCLKPPPYLYFMKVTKAPIFKVRLNDIDTSRHFLLICHLKNELKGCEHNTYALFRKYTEMLRGIHTSPKYAQSLDTTKHEFVWSNMNEDICRVLYPLYRKQFLIKKYVAIWKARVRACPPTHVNHADLDLVPFSQDRTCIEIVQHHKIYRFSTHDVLNLFKNTLEHRFEFKARPTLPRNPYTNEPFNDLHIQYMVERALENTPVSNRNYQTVRLFHMSQCNLTLFKKQFSHNLEQTALVHAIMDEDADDYEFDEILTFLLWRTPHSPFDEDYPGSIEIVQKFLSIHKITYLHHLVKILKVYCETISYVESSYKKEVDCLRSSPVYSLVNQIARHIQTEMMTGCL